MRGGITRQSIALCIVALLAVLSVVAPVGLVASAASPIEVTDQAVENRFPNTLRFTFKARADRPIVKATVYWRQGDRPLTSYADAKIAAGRQVSGDYTLDLRRNYYPPGVEMRYQWLLEDDAGEKARSDWKPFTLDDVRFQWQSTTVGNITIQWYRGGDSFGGALRDPAAGAIKRLQSEAGIEAKQPVKILIYATDQDFQTAADPGTHEWAGGVAFSREAVVIIQASPGNIDYAKRTIPHELSHVIIHHATENPFGGLPTWLDEGLAMLAEGEQSPGFNQSLQAAIRENRLISVWSLSSAFPTDAREAELSYAQSYALVKFVVDKWGQGGMTKLLAQFREGSTYDDALKAALGVDTYGLDDAWRASVGLPPVPAAAQPLAATATAARSTPSAGTPAAGTTSVAKSSAVAQPIPTPVATVAVATAVPTSRSAEPTPAPSPANPSATGTGLNCAAPAALGMTFAGGLAFWRRRRQF